MFWKSFLSVLMIILLTSGDGSCDGGPPAPQSASGVSKATAKVKTNANGLTTEQQNIVDRLAMDNKPGSIKHLYVISAYSGQVLIYSTVRGKVTSSGKRLTPTTISGTYNTATSGFGVDIGPVRAITQEVLQDDGSYGSSIEYLFWWDTKGNYHQHYPEGGQIIHVSDQPLVVKGIIINMELTTKDGGE